MRKEDFTFLGDDAYGWYAYLGKDSSINGTYLFNDGTLVKWIDKKRGYEDKLYVLGKTKEEAMSFVQGFLDKNNKEQFSINGSGSFTYVSNKDTYLFPDGKVRTWTSALVEGVHTKVYFASYADAEKALETYKNKEVAPMKYVKSDSGRYTGAFEGKAFVINPDHVNYSKLVECFNTKNFSEFWALANPAVAVEKFMKSGVVVEGGQVFYNGEEVKNSLVDKIFSFMEDKLPVEPLLKFLENLMKNPSKDSRDELYDFLQSGEFPLTPNGTFLAYKGLNKNYRDCHTDTIDNRPGATITRLQRTQVDEDRRNECSYGYHVGSYSYANSFQKGHLVMVEVNPADVVAVPKDYSCQKCRVTWYQPIQDCECQFDCALVEQNDNGDYEEYYDEDEGF